MVFMITGCAKAKQEIITTEDEEMPTIAGSCDNWYTSFLVGVKNSTESNTYIIKGIVLDKIEYGLSIRLVEDLKGNFPKNVDTFTAWGYGNSFLESNRSDRLILYNTQDVLIMHLAPVCDLSHMKPQGHTWFEKPEDYATLDCEPSVLKLSDGYVTGYLFPPKILDDRKWSDLSSEEQTSFLESWSFSPGRYEYMATLSSEKLQEFLQAIFTAQHTSPREESAMAWEDFQKELNELLTSKNVTIGP